MASVMDFYPPQDSGPSLWEGAELGGPFCFRVEFLGCWLLFVSMISLSVVASERLVQLLLCPYPLHHVSLLWKPAHYLMV